MGKAADIEVNPRFTRVVATLERSLRRLLAMQPTKLHRLPKNMPEAGVYLFSEGRKHLYVGRSNYIRGRLSRHSRPSATHRMAAFAFRLAREATGQVRATYRKKGSRSDLISKPKFLAAFQKAKARIREMDVRFVEETDPVQQAVLELYVAVALATPYNEFNTH